jgi:CAAX protease family protein
LIPGLKIVCYLLAVVLLGVILAPWLYWAGRWAAEYEGFEFLAETDFQRYFNRSILIAAFVLLPPTLRWIGLTRLRTLGLIRNPARWVHLFGGFSVAVILMALLGILLLALGIYELKTAIPWIELAQLLLTAWCVALLEEFLFRGAILGLFRQSLTTGPAMVAVSAIFSIIHFLKPPEEKIATVTWFSGFELLPHVFWQFTEPLMVLAGFTTLFTLGMLLAHARVSTASLWLSIGLHAGLVFGKMGFSKCTKRLSEALPWFGDNLLVGIASILVLLLLWLIVWILFLRGPNRSFDL